MKIQYEFIKREIAGSTFLVPVGAGVKKIKGMISVNDVAVRIWDLITEGKNQDEIVDVMAAEYLETREKIAADVAEFIADLRELEILAPEEK